MQLIMQACLFDLVHFLCNFKNENELNNFSSETKKKENTKSQDNLYSVVTFRLNYMFLLFFRKTIGIVIYTYVMQIFNWISQICSFFSDSKIDNLSKNPQQIIQGLTEPLHSW